MKSRQSNYSSTDGLTLIAFDNVDEAFLSLIRDDKTPEWDYSLMRAHYGFSYISHESLLRKASLKVLRNKYLDVGELMQLRDIVNKNQQLLCFGENIGYQAVLANCLRRRRCQIDIVFHGQGLSSRRNKMLANLCKGRSVRFLCLSDQIRNIVFDEYGIPESQLLTAGWGVDANFFRPLSRDPDLRTDSPSPIVSAGTASRDYATLLEAVVGLDVMLKVAADSHWFREKLNININKIPENVQIFSADNYFCLRNLYNCAKFVVVPLIDARHACGYAVIAEAMAMGKAVIATKNQAHSDLILDGVTGIYVPPSDAGALRTALQKLIADPLLAGEMGRRGRERILSRFSLEKHCAHLLDLVGVQTSRAKSPSRNSYGTGESAGGQHHQVGIAEGCG